MSTSNRYALAWLAALSFILLMSFVYVSSLSVSAIQTEGIISVLTYNPASAFDTNNDGLETITGIIDVTLQNSMFNFTPKNSELCSVWQVYSADTSNSKFYCQGSADCCAITSAISPVNITDRAGEWDVFYLSYNDNGVSTSSNIIKAQVWSANSTDLTAIKFSNWSNISAHFASVNQITINLGPPADGTWTSNATYPIQFSVNSSSPLSSCELISNTTSTITITSPGLNVPLEFRPTFAAGNNAWRIKCTDNAQNIAETPNQVLNLDSFAPIVTIEIPATNSSHGQPSIPARFSVTDSSPIVACTSYLDSNPTILGNVKVNSTPYNYAISTALGQHSLQIKCADLAQNQANSTINSFAHALPGQFSMTLSKTQIELTEPISVNIQSPLNTQVNLVVRRFDLLNRAMLESHHILQSPYSFTFNDTFFEGTYTFVATQNSETATAIASATNNLSGEIILSPSLPFSGKEILINSSPKGGSKPISSVFTLNGVTYAGDLWSRVLDSGIYSVNLVIKDFYNNNKTLSKSFSVYNDFIIEVEEQGGAKMIDARITLGADIKYTNASGQARFQAMDGHYFLKVEKNTELHSELISVNNSETRKLTLQVDESAPNITLNAPADGDSTTSPVSFSLQASERSNCSLYTSSDGNLWTLKYTQEVEGTVQFEQAIDSGMQSYRFECKDPQGHVSVTPSRRINVSVEFSGISDELSTQVTKEADEIQTILENVNGQLTQFNSLNKQERDLAEALDIYKTLDEIKLALTAARKNLSDTRFEGLSEDALEEKRSQILDSVEQMKPRIPTSFNILEKTEAIIFPTNQDIAALADDIAKALDIKLGSQKSSFLKQIQDMQSEIGVTATLGVVEITYLDGSSETFSLIIKNIDVENAQGQLIESVPKEIAQSASEIKSKILFAVVKDDPVLKFPIPLDNKISYYVKGKKSLDTLSGAKTILVGTPKQIQSSKEDGITGFAIFGAEGFDLGDSSKTWLMVAAAVLLSFYLFYSLNLMDVMIPGNRKIVQREKELRGIIDLATKALEKKSAEEAGLKYTELQMIFEAMTPMEQDRHFSSLENIAHRINLLYAEQTLEQIEACLKTGSNEEALRLYPGLNEAYEKLVPEHKAVIAPRCMDAFKRLNG